MTRLDDKEKRIKYFKAYYLKHKEHILVKNRKWYKANPEKVREIYLRSRQKNKGKPHKKYPIDKERRKLTQEIYRQRHREEIRQRQIKYRNEHREKIRQLNRKYYYKDIEFTRKRNREKMRAYYKLHPERIKAANKRYLDKKKRLQNGIDKGTGKRVAGDN